MVIPVKTVTLTSVLKDLDLEPAWEKYRRFALGASIGISIIPIFMILGGLSLACIPIDQAVGERPSLENDRTKLTVPQTAYVNIRCSRDDEFFVVKMVGYAVLIAGIICIIFSRYWIFDKDVTENLRKFAKARELTDKSNLGDEEKKEMCSIKMTGAEITDDHRTMREICLLLTVHGPKEDLYRSYFVRSIILIGGLLVYSLLTLAYVVLMWKFGKTFTCQIKELMPVTSTNETSVDLFICTVNQTGVITLFLSIFFGLIFSQFAAVLGGLICVQIGMKKYEKEEKTNKHEAKMSKSLKLLLVLSDHSKKSRKLEVLVKYLYSKEYKNDLKLEGKKGPDDKKEDTDREKIKVYLFGKTPQVAGRRSQVAGGLSVTQTAMLMIG